MVRFLDGIVSDKCRMAITPGRHGHLMPVVLCEAGSPYSSTVLREFGRSGAKFIADLSYALHVGVPSCWRH